MKSHIYNKELNENAYMSTASPSCSQHTDGHKLTGTCRTLQIQSGVAKSGKDKTGGSVLPQKLRRQERSWGEN